MEVTPYFCDLCKVSLSGEKCKKAHLTGKKHQLALHNAHTLNKKIKCGVYITGFPNLVTKEKITKFINELGQVKDIYVANQNKFAIVEFVDESVAQNLLSKRNFHFMGKMLHVKPRIVKDLTAEMTDAERPDDEEFDSINESLKKHSDITSAVQELISLLQPDQQTLIQKYKHLCYDLQDTLQKTFPGCKIYPFGSTVTELNFKNSDVDVYVEVQNSIDSNVQKPTAAQYVRRARNALPKSGLFHNIFAIPKAKTPIVKCVHTQTNISCDFNFKNMLGVCNSLLIKYYLTLDHRLKPIVLIIKYWSKVHELTSNRKITSYALMMLIIFYLQQDPYFLPNVVQMQADKEAENIQEGWNGGFRPVLNRSNILENYEISEVIVGFFKFYSNFDYNFNIICPYLGKAIPKTDFLKPETLPPVFNNYKTNISHMLPLNVETPICLQDPFEHNYNLTKAISSKAAEEFIALCKIAVNAFETASTTNVLYKLFTEKPDYEKNKTSSSDNTCKFRLTMGSALTYLEQQLSPDAKDKAAEIRKLWYYTVDQFIITVLIKVLKLTVSVEQKSEIQKVDTHTDIPESNILGSVTFHCRGTLNLWEARKAISRDLTVNNELPNLERQIFLSDYICNELCKGISLQEPIVEFYLTLTAKESPVHIELDIRKVSARKGCFKTFLAFFSNRLPHWFLTYERELNDNIKRNKQQ